MQRIGRRQQLRHTGLRVFAELTAVDDANAPQSGVVAQASLSEEEPAPQLVVLQNERRRFPRATRVGGSAIQRLWERSVFLG